MKNKAAGANTSPAKSDKTRALSTTQRLISAVQEARAKLEAVKRAKQEPIAIIGVGCRFPKGGGGR